MARGLKVRQAEFEETHIVINKKGDTRPAKALKLPDGRLLASDKGFEGNVGKSHLANLGQLQMQRAVELPPKLAAVAVGEAMKQPEMMRAVSRQAAEMVRRVAAEKVARGQMMYAGALTLPVLEALAVRNIRPQSALIALSDERILHGLRDNKVKPLPSEFWEKIPELLLEPEAVLLDKSQAKKALLFVYPMPDGKGKFVVTLDYEAKTRHPFSGKKEKIAVNIVNTGAIVENGKQLDSLLFGFEQIWEKP